jgi:hypothetical protein
MTDHKHAMPAFATTSDIADVAATESAGSAATVPRGDHVHRLAITATRGDIIRRGASDNERLGLGTSGYLLGSNGTDVVWVDPTTTVDSGIRGRSIWAVPVLHDPTSSGTTQALPANGGSIAIAMNLTARLDFDEVWIRNGDTGSLRTAEYRLYYDDGTANAVFVTGTDGTYSFTPSGSPSDRSSTNMSGSPVAISPGVYWLVIRNTHASNTFGVQYSNVGSTYWNTRNGSYDKTLGSALGSTLDFSTGWSGQARSYSVRMTGRLFNNSL